MRLKHNKKRNTAFVYEALIRELTTSIIKKNKNLSIEVINFRIPFENALKIP